MAGHFRGRHQVGQQCFPDYPQFSGFMKPCRFEGEVQDLEVEGTIPPEIDGVFYRVMPDPQFAPFVENDPWFNGDGSVSAFTISGGRAHFKQRYVRTEKFVREREARRALAGKYRNKYTDAVEFKVRTTANTNIFHFNGSLLACKEDAPPYRMDPHTLETVGLEDFGGTMPSCTFTAHPKVDPDTSEMVCFGYEAKGDGTPDVCYFTVGTDGKVAETVWCVCPVAAMIHDFAVTKNWVIFPVIPQTCDLERMKAGGEHWQWDSNIPFYIGILPRYGAHGDDVKWFRAPNAFPGHTSNAFENDDGHIVFDLALSDKNVFFWWPDAEGNAPDPHEIHAEMVRFTIDPRATDLDLAKPEMLIREDCEFARIDERFAMRDYRHTFFDMMKPALGTDFNRIGPVMGGGFAPYNSLGHYDIRDKKLEVYYPGDTHMVQEPVYVPRKDGEEGDGWLIVLVNNYATMSSELHIIDVRDFTRAQAKVLLPIRLRAGLHGNWVST